MYSGQRAILYNRGEKNHEQKFRQKSNLNYWLDSWFHNYISKGLKS